MSSAETLNRKIEHAGRYWSEPGSAGPLFRFILINMGVEKLFLNGTHNLKLNLVVSFY